MQVRPESDQPAQNTPSLLSKRQKGRRVFLITASTLTALFGFGTGFLGNLYRRGKQQRMRANAPFLAPQPAPLPSLKPMPFFTFAGHQRIVRALAWSPDGTRLASGGDDSLLLLWSLDGTILNRIAHPTPVQTLAWSPESQRIVSGSATSLSFFSADGLLLARSTDQHTAQITSVAWTPQQQMSVVSASLDKKAIVWDTTRYQPQAIFTRHTSAITSVAWDAQGSLIASASQGGVARLWKSTTAQEVHGFYQASQKALRACAFAPHGTTLAIGDDTGRISIWKDAFLCQHTHEDVTDSVCLDAPMQLLSETGHAIRSLAWSPDGRYLASGNNNGSWTLWQPTQKQRLFTMMILPGMPTHSLSWAPDGKHLATASGSTVLIWTIPTIAAINVE